MIFQANRLSPPISVVNQKVTMDINIRLLASNFAADYTTMLACFDRLFTWNAGGSRVAPLGSESNQITRPGGEIDLWLLPNIAAHQNAS